MKKLILLLILIALHMVQISAEENKKVTLGLHLLGGGRYDDVRMCVGSDQGIKGGPIVEGYFDIRINAGEKGTLSINLPVLRPLLFGIAYQMLQLEPQITYEYLIPSKSEKLNMMIAGGLGAVFHYGPDYNSTPENSGESFFAAGPLISASAGIAIRSRSGVWTPALKIFYAPLFSPEYQTGHVLGGGLELYYSF
jgi:hypothetical protein